MNGQRVGPWRTKGPNKAITIMAVYNQHNASGWLRTPSRGRATSTGPFWLIATRTAVAYHARWQGPPLSFNNRIMSVPSIDGRDDRDRRSERASELCEAENRRQRERGPLLQTEIISIPQQRSASEYLGNSSCHPHSLPQFHYLSPAHDRKISATAATVRTTGTRSWPGTGMCGREAELQGGQK